MQKSINLSIISPRKIPSLYKLFEKAGGDLTASQTKNYAKDPRHLVLLRGYSLKERPISPPPGSLTPNQNQIPNTSIPLTSLPSPLPGNDSPISGQPQTNPNLLPSAGTSAAAGIGPTPVYRPPGASGINQLPQHPMSLGMVNARGNIMSQLPAPPVYHQTNRPRWPMLPPQSQPRPPYMQNQAGGAAQGSALIAQLTQPPSALPGAGVNQFGQSKVDLSSFIWGFHLFLCSW